MTILSSIISIALAFVSFNVFAAEKSDSNFRFESVKTLDEMRNFVRDHFPLNTPRQGLRTVFVTQGQATLKTHPVEPGVEKYIYDINLCNYYIWRWNISTDYDQAGKLLQAYVNGMIIFPDGKPQRVVPKVAEKGKKSSIFKMQRPRPEAYKGESSLGYILFDRDSDLTTIADQAILGAGPSRADPMDMGRLITYPESDPWRSIFDSDAAERIVPYHGSCTEVENHMQRHKASQAK
ncbi:hypothetical protein R0381_003440 [Jeongeupia wiesaeckerbachi]|uniref:hypothetical protein n=1 Tax=Jeongeupia wiesaeckerbachi TaxID=3051218 RepID=UPI003D8029BC